VKYLIVGLGNIGPEYANTRHNIGFRILDAFAEASNIFFESKRYGDIAEYKYKSRTYILLKPSTYMNLSGKAVNYWLQKSKLEVKNMLVIVDDLALPFGHLRMRIKGGDGGHKGLKSINEVLGHHNYTRMRFGISSTFVEGQQVDYVLSPFTPEEEEILPERFIVTKNLIESFGTIGAERTMNFFNNNKPPVASGD
jgi:PTH1 family peptidyl-tRNA hydrolase